MYLTQGLHRSLQRCPAKMALAHRGGNGARVAPGARSLRFDELLPAIARRAAALAAHGVRRGDRMTLLSPNDDRLAQALFACWWLGAVTCPLNVRAATPELAHALADCDPALLLYDEALAERLPSTPVRCITLNAFADAAHAHAPLPDTRTGGDALAASLYTGGTTGRSKGVMLTHANFWTASITRAAELPNPPDSVSLLVAPLFHVAGLGRLVGQTTAGGSCVTMATCKPDALQAAYSAAVARFGPIDVLISGAAGNFLAQAMDMSPNAFKTVVGIDLLGSFNDVRAAYGHLRRPGASVVQISAAQASIATPYQAHVCAAKAGVDMLTRVLALEWGAEGIRINSIAPRAHRRHRRPETPGARRRRLAALGRAGAAAAPGQLRRHRAHGDDVVQRLGQLHHRRGDPGRRRPGADRPARLQRCCRRNSPEPQMSGNKPKSGRDRHAPFID